MTGVAPAVVHRLLAGWHRAECVLAVSAFAVIALLLVADVAARELVVPMAHALGFGGIRLAFPAAPKMALAALVVGTYAGVGVASATATHFVPRLGHGWFGVQRVAAVERAGEAVTALVWLAAAGYAAVFVAGSHAAGLRIALLDWPAWPVQVALPLGFASAALRHACFAAWPDTRPARQGDLS
jgi:hypothetical protein